VQLLFPLEISPCLPRSTRPLASHRISLVAEVTKVATPARVSISSNQNSIYMNNLTTFITYIFVYYLHTGFHKIIILCSSPVKSSLTSYLDSRPDEAWEVIRKLHHTPSGDDTLSKKEFYQMQKQLDSDRRVKRGKWDIFATAPNRKRSMIGFGLMFGNQFTVRFRWPL
jgi:hypothetical protein